MGAGHSHALYVHEHSGVHHLAPEAKLIATLLFVASVAVTPREAIWAFGIYVVALGAIAWAANVPYRFIAARLLAVLPFVIFAFLIPFIAEGEEVEFLGISLSVEGLWGAWNIIAKATLGATASIILAATTEVPDMLKGMSRLKVPPILTSIAGFMIRYLELIAEELGRMRTAMTARAYDPRWIWQVKPIANSAGALFIRSYERGERVHAAMLARGFNGTVPDLTHNHAHRRDWVLASVVVIGAAAVATVALVTT